MAEVVKRLRPRIVVPICVGSNPIFRPIFKRPQARSFLAFLVAKKSLFVFISIYCNRIA